MIISILNCDKNFGIGKKNGLLFSLPLDMKYFRETTSGHTVCMGENTLLSFPSGKPLKNRTNIVLSKSSEYDFPNVINVHSLEELIKIASELSEKEDVFIIGGASIYRQTLPYVDMVYLTKVDADGEAEVFFPNIDQDPNFKLINESEIFIDNGYPIKFTKYINISKQKML